ncbi:MAG: peptidoglycan DD-metalloendopeptidase family protein [Thermoanaerobaculia bacterium]|nr:peptidoglycan DD-metalloendopeptidase family protein [Thermoanaerobaculia bacterium]
MRSLYAGLVIATLVATAWVPSVSARPDEREETLERIRGEIARLQAKLSKVQQEASSLAGEYEETRLQLELQEQRVAESKAAQEVARDRVQGLENRVVELEESLAKVRLDLRNRLGALYRLGRGGYLRLVLSLQNSRQALPALRQLRYFARRDGKALDRFVETKARLAVEEKELDVERQRVETWAQEEEERRSELATIESKQSRLLARLQTEQKSLQSESKDLADKERKLSNFLAFLYGRNQGPQAGAPIQSFRGVLDWPVRATVSVPFGPRVDPRYKTKTPHNGLEFNTASGEDVKAVYAGKVLFAAPFKGYGPTVIINHPDKAFSLYAGLGSLQVGVGDVISLGQVVGRSAESLYFEIRVENRPEDPRLWLRE